MRRRRRKRKKRRGRRGRKKKRRDDDEEEVEGEEGEERRRRRRRKEVWPHRPVSLASRHPDWIHFFISFLSAAEIRHFLAPCRLNHLPACSVSLRETPPVFSCHKVPLRIFRRRWQPPQKKLSSCFHVRFSKRPQKQLKWKRSSHFPIRIYIFLHKLSWSLDMSQPTLRYLLSFVDLTCWVDVKANARRTKKGNKMVQSVRQNSNDECEPLQKQRSTHSRAPEQ